MKNNVVVESKTFANFSTTIAVLVVMAVAFAITFAIISVDMNKTTNGPYEMVSGTIAEVSLPEDEEDNFVNIKLQGYETEYRFVSAMLGLMGGKQSAFELLEQCKNQAVKVDLLVPEEHGKTNVWVVEFCKDGQVVVDKASFVEAQTESNNQAKLVFGIVIGLPLIVALILVVLKKVLRKKTVPFVEFVASTYVPPTNKTLAEYNKNLLVALLGPWACGVALAFVLPMPFILWQIKIAVTVVLLAIGTALAIVFGKKAKRNLQEHKRLFVQKFPFNHAKEVLENLTPKQRAQIEKRSPNYIETAQKEAEINNDLFFDMITEVPMLFTEEGVDLVFFDEDQEPEQLLPGELPKFSVVKSFEYSRLNLEACAVYSANNLTPVLMFVRSRLGMPFSVDLSGFVPQQENGQLPLVRFESDFHLPLDSKLLQTLTKFGVKVENLAETLENLPTLAEQHAKDKPKAFGKIVEFTNNPTTM